MVRVIGLMLTVVFMVTTLYAQDIPSVAFEPMTRNADWTVVERDFDGVSMVLVPAGCFLMGDDPSVVDLRHQEAQTTWPNAEGADRELITALLETGENEVCFEQPFWINHTEVTQAQFAQLDGQKAVDNAFAGEDKPIDNITWFEARDYCVLRGGRLPTEAEWEYAARGPSNLLYPWGNEWDGTLTVWERETKVGSAPVGSIPENASWVGAVDMSGNV